VTVGVETAFDVGAKRRRQEGGSRRMDRRRSSVGGRQEQTASLLRRRLNPRRRRPRGGFVGLRRVSSPHVRRRLNPRRIAPTPTATPSGLACSTGIWHPLRRRHCPRRMVAQNFFFFCSFAVLDSANTYKFIHAIHINSLQVPYTHIYI
jgi:hypothetical protein